MTVTPTLPPVIINCFSTEILPSFFPEIINRIVDCYSLRCVFCCSVHSFGYPLFNFSLLSLRNELVSECFEKIQFLCKQINVVLKSHPFRFPHHLVITETDVEGIEHWKEPETQKAYHPRTDISKKLQRRFLSLCHRDSSPSLKIFTP